MPRPTKHRSRRAANTAHPNTPVLSPEDQARLIELLAAPESGVMARFDALAAEAPGGPLALIDALGSSHDEGAGHLLAALAVAAPDKEQRKAARRALHKLRSAGIVIAIPSSIEPVSATLSTQEPYRPVQAYASPTDGVGSRVLWLLLERPHGGLGMLHLAVNDVVGLKDALVEETTRRRFERRLADWNERTELAAFEIPVEYGLALLSEALALNQESHFPLPREFVIRRSWLGELPPPPESALIHQHVSRGQIFLLPNLLEQSGDLLDGEPELESWGFAYKEAEPYAREYRTIFQSSSLVLTAEPREARLERILDTAVDAMMTPVMRRAFKRRLEEIAYVFWQSGRERSARQAVAAAFAINETGSLRSHPLVRAVVRKSIEMAMQVDLSGMGVPPGANRTAYDPI